MVGGGIYTSIDSAPPLFLRVWVWLWVWLEMAPPFQNNCFLPVVSLLGQGCYCLASIPRGPAASQLTSRFHRPYWVHRSNLISLLLACSPLQWAKQQDSNQPVPVVQYALTAWAYFWACLALNTCLTSPLTSRTFSAMPAKDNSAVCRVQEMAGGLYIRFKTVFS